MESGRGKKRLDLSLETLKNLLEHEPRFLRNVFLGQFNEIVEGELAIGPDEKPKLAPVTIVAFYMAYINNPPIRKIFAPYFLEALEACSGEEIFAMVQGTRPITSETYRAIEKVGKTSKSIEAYVCYAFVTTNIHDLDKDELASAISFLIKDETVGEKRKDFIRTLETIYDALMKLQDNNNENGLFSIQALKFANFAGENFSNMYYVFDNLPVVCNVEGAILNRSNFFLLNKCYLNLSNTQLNSLYVEYKKNHDKKNLTILNLCGSSLSELNVPDELVILIDHITLSSKIIIEMLGMPDVINTYVPAMKRNMASRIFTVLHILTVYGQEMFEELNFLSELSIYAVDKKHFNIQLPIEIDSIEAFVDELNKYSAVEKRMGKANPDSLEYKAFSNVRTLLVLAVLEKLLELKLKNIDIEPFYRAALKHPCFGHRDTVKWLFNAEWTTSQKALREGYQAIVAKFQNELDSPRSSNNVSSSDGVEIKKKKK